MMLNTEVSWNKALTDNNIKGLVGCLRGLCTEGEGDTSECLARFNCWLQSSAELAKKELLMLCFGRCEGLWMFVDENAFALVHKLVLKLKNLLSLVHLVQKQSEPVHTKQGSKASYIWGCWKQEHHAMRQHILLGRLVQWWSLTGLLPKYPEAHALKRISQMWREMDRKQRRTCLQLSSYAEDKYRWSSLIQGMVAHMDKQHGPIWVSEDCAYQTYPPPSLEALLKLVLLPNIDMVSVQAIVMYFVLDVSNFLQCKDDLQQSFCHVFSVSSAFSQQIFGFWLLDQGLVTDSMDVLLSPRACPPALSWHHWAVLRTLLRTGENKAALKYLYSITPAMENIHDIKLRVDVLIQNKCISAAWALLRGLHEDVHLFKHFIRVCENRGICSHALATLCEGMARIPLTKSRNMQSNEAQIQNQKTIGLCPVRPEPGFQGQTPRPLSAWLYQMDEQLTPRDFVRILRQSISEICPLPKKRSSPFSRTGCRPRETDKTRENKGEIKGRFWRVRQTTAIWHHCRNFTASLQHCDPDPHHSLKSRKCARLHYLSGYLPGQSGSGKGELSSVY
ncbi:protein ELYS-like [Pimephales promelas]|uniref:protein ELYS-like n=1 Tax=Pimephales promelas TaxID=90988 RepID=UPI001955CB8D|nr:protein ELYS-like [Pimephales promelas]